MTDTLPRRTIVSFGVTDRQPADHPQRLRSFRGGLRRLRRDLAAQGFFGELALWESYPPGSPRHRDAPFAFKPFCLEQARRSGSELVLWLDASIRVKKPLDEIFQAIERDGYVLFAEDHSVGEYCKDAALAPLGITREESFHVPSVWACAVGIDLRSDKGKAFLDRWLSYATDGVTFPGPKWSGMKGFPRTASSDPRVRGHRYDQTAASVIARELGMDRLRPKSEFAEYFDNRRARCMIVGGLSIRQAFERLATGLSSLFHA